jgi:hypothetical protein
MRAIIPREGVTLARIAVDCRIRFLGKDRFDLSLGSLGNELVFLCQVHQQRRIEAGNFSQILLGVTAVICDPSVNAITRGR